jgi:hypothetical protein
MSKSPNARFITALKKYKVSLPDYARDVVRIRPKSGGLVPLVLNAAQLEIHRRIEQQRQATGKVRAIILKGRQQGCSTYVQTRFWWRLAFGRGLRAFILSHQQVSSAKLFDIADRLQANLPDPFKPHLGASNAKELILDQQDCGYEVSTAGGKDVGRSGTFQLFHGSEVGFWDDAEKHMIGIGQAVPNVPGSEIILESTANGIGNMFHKLWQSAETGASEYHAIFIPWFMTPEYRLEVPSHFALDEKDAVYQQSHRLDLEQMAWRRQKIVDDCGGDVLRFQQEYPATAAEAFVAVGVEPFMPAALVQRGVTRDTMAGDGPLILGVDPARFGEDCTAIVGRRGRCVTLLERLRKADTMAVCGLVASIIQRELPSRVFIDVGGLGAGIFDRLMELGFRCVIAVNFGESAIESARYYNRRAEIWAKLKEWLSQPSPKKLFDDPGLIADLSGPRFSYDSQGRVKLEKKEDMAKRGVRSPDAGDALALTFAMPVANEAPRFRGSAIWEDMEQAFDEVEHGGSLRGLNVG